MAAASSSFCSHDCLLLASKILLDLSGSNDHPAPSNYVYILHTSNFFANFKPWMSLLSEQCLHISCIRLLELSASQLNNMLTIYTFLCCVPVVYCYFGKINFIYEEIILSFQVSPVSHFVCFIWWRNAPVLCSAQVSNNSKNLLIGYR